jgi:NAD+ diphosphatase
VGYRSGVTEAVVSVPTLARAVALRGGIAHDDTDAVAELWAATTTQVLPMLGSRFAVDQGLDGPRLATIQPVDVERSPAGPVCFLGVVHGAAHFAVLGAETAALSNDGYVGLREVGALLDDAEAGLAVHAVALAEWHVSHRFCPQCGQLTKVSAAGLSRRCGTCAVQHFPRTDPAVIMMVMRGEAAESRCLLGRRGQWPAGRFSTLAGFVDAGESLEHAVIREIREEAGVAVTDVTYAGSQPWPFPRSLMLGFTAQAITDNTRPDGEEIEELRWFSRSDLAAAVASGAVTLPAQTSIARWLIERWLGEPPAG